MAAALLGVLVLACAPAAEAATAPQPQVTTDYVEPAPAAAKPPAPAATEAPATEAEKPHVSTDYVGAPMSPAAAKIMEEYSDGDYWVVGSDGQEVLKMDPDNNDLRMAVADSLAWTGRYDDAIKQYRMLADTPLASKAALGLANVYEWSGRPDLARPLYAQSMSIRPIDPEITGEATDGLHKVRQELRSRTDLKHINKSDSDAVKQRGYELDHYWRGEDPAVRYGIALRSNRYVITNRYFETLQHDASASVEDLGMAMQPRLQLSAQQKPRKKGFGTLRLKPLSGANLHLTVGHVNWADMQFQPQGLVMGVSANQAGIDASTITRVGTFSGSFSNYRVSDQNRVWEEQAKFYPAWHFLGEDFRYYIGIEGRRARQNVDYYWSPAGGYQSGTLGFEYEVSSNSTDYSISAERGFHVAGEAVPSYSIGFDARHYVGRDWAILLSGATLRNERGGNYHSKFLTLGLERLW